MRLRQITFVALLVTIPTFSSATITCEPCMAGGPGYLCEENFIGSYNHQWNLYSDPPVVDLTTYGNATEKARVECPNINSDTFWVVWDFFMVGSQQQLFSNEQGWCYAQQQA